MGMAASQARYLALTARKTNTEYEGQQINQARTALANQSANLFNRLLDMKVPDPPKTTDYTKIQYSYSDGDNESVIDSWQQLSNADPNYNYIVNHYYYTNLFTGGQKQLQNPEVTLGNIQKSNLYSIKDVQSVELNPATGQVEIKDTNDNIIRAYVPISELEMTPKLEQSIRAFEKHEDIKIDDTKTYAWQDSSSYWHFLLDTDITEDYATQYYVGNCPVTAVKGTMDDNGNWTFESKEVEAELTQIIHDVKDTNMDKYLTFNTLDDKLQYTGEGVYQFQMNGVTYFTNETDLWNALKSYNQYGKPIENQNRFPYYNATYVRTKIEEKNHALLETDGAGRFKSIKFDNDSIVYALNTETVTDEAAYQDAMNRYNHERAVYEKTIADINARTSIIQKEDRTLELRLRQLDTEQKALSTEMEAVKKVIKDNIESTFKTFSD